MDRICSGPPVVKDLVFPTFRSADFFSPFLQSSGVQRLVCDGIDAAEPRNIVRYVDLKIRGFLQG